MLFENRQAYLEKAVPGKQRTHRLITVGLTVESIVPQTKELTETGILFPHGKHFESLAGGAFIRSAEKTTPVFPGRRKAVTKDSTLSFSIAQIKRGAGQNAIASATYRAGERLYSYYGEVSDYTKRA